MSAHADRDRSERRELESYLAADKAEPAPDADRVNAYAAKVAEVIPALRYIWKGDETARELIDALEVLIETEIAPNVIALADREQATLLAENARLRQALWDTWAALGHDTDGDTGPGALIAGMGVDGFARMVIEDATRWRKESEEDYDADMTRLERALDMEQAKVAGLIATTDQLHSDVIELGGYLRDAEAKVARVVAVVDAEDARIAEANQRFKDEGRICEKSGRTFRLAGIITTRGLRAALAEPEASEAQP